MTLNIAHRGASAHAPENTMFAFRSAEEFGADGIEIDVRLSADGVPVVIHDATVDRTTDGHGEVACLRLDQLRTLDAGTWFNPDCAGARIPTFSEVLDTFGGRLLLNIELKQVAWRDMGLERAVVELIRLHGLEPDGGSEADILISSFNPGVLHRVARLASRIPRGLIYSPAQPLSSVRGRLVWLSPHPVLHPRHDQVDAEYVAQAHQRGYRVNTWTVDDPSEMHRLLSLGVDGITSNTPDVLRAVLQSTSEIP
jgi:glycerophosphoryl diester phosphodiesterase